VTPEDRHAANMARTPAPAPLSERQFPPRHLEERTLQIKRRAMQRAVPRPGGVQPYLPMEGP
jgi:hypothetical protein